jgi:hypothetical protein
MKASLSIYFFMLLTTSTLATAAASMDKESYSEMVCLPRSYISTAMSTTNRLAMHALFLLKSRQRALMLSGLDYANMLSR